MLVWGVFAYIAMSHLVDLFGLNADIAWQILDISNKADSARVLELRALVGAWIILMLMSVTCIAVGFETADQRQ
jgi:hypothetical protein